MTPFLRRADLWSGLLFLGFAAVILLAGAEYPLGRAGRIGPGYAPRLLAIAIGAVGLFLVGRAIAWGREAVDARVAWRPVTLVLASVGLFAATFPLFGLLPAIVATATAASFAQADNGPVTALVLGGLLAVFSWLLFVKALGLSLPAFLLP